MKSLVIVAATLTAAMAQTDQPTSGPEASAYMVGSLFQMADYMGRHCPGVRMKAEARRGFLKAGGISENDIKPNGYLSEPFERGAKYAETAFQPFANTSIADMPIACDKKFNEMNAKRSVLEWIKP